LSTVITYFLLHYLVHSLCNDLVGIGRPITSGYSHGKTIFWTLHAKADQLKIKTYITYSGPGPHSGLPGSGNLYLLPPSHWQWAQIAQLSSYTNIMYQVSLQYREGDEKTVWESYVLPRSFVTSQPSHTTALDTIISLAKYGTPFATTEPKKHKLFSTK
jgi:hypothetical protein